MRELRSRPVGLARRDDPEDSGGQRPHGRGTAVMANNPVLEDLAAATGAMPQVAVGPVDHVDSHGKPTACGAYIDEDSMRTWPSGFTLWVRVPHWAGGFKVKLKSTKRWEITQV